jgi:hypothetical protein
MEISVTAKSVEYIPDWNKNKEDANPIRVTLNYLNTAQRGQLLPWRADEKGNAIMEPDRRGLLLSGIAKIENLIVVEDGVRKDVRTSRALLEAYGLEALAIELATQIIGMNAREVEKNF